MKKTVSNILFTTALLLLFTGPAGAYSIKSNFPLHQGDFWNFITPGEGPMTSWVINGTLSVRDVGKTFVLLQENGRMLCLREDWDGIYIYAEYWPDRFYIPDKPLLFLPNDLTEGTPLKSSANLKVYTDPGGYSIFKETGKAQRTVSFLLKERVDLTLNSKEFKDCLLIEKQTDENGILETELLWLAPSIGPVKRIIEKGEKKTVYALTSHSQSPSDDKTYQVKDYFPIKPDIKKTYINQRGNSAIIKILEKEKARSTNIQVTPFSDPSGDIHYYAIDERGLLLVQKYWAAYAGITTYPPPKQPVIVLPPELKQGTYHTDVSYPISFRARSMSQHEGSYPELQYSSIVLGTEEVNTPSGTYKDCIKISLTFTSANYIVNFEVLRIGCIWLAKDEGIVKEDVVNMYNFFLPGQVNSIFDIRSWELSETGKLGNK